VSILQLQTENRQLQTANRQPPTANRQLPTANCQPPTANCAFSNRVFHHYILKKKTHLIVG
jgi:hypothetical protein